MCNDLLRVVPLGHGSGDVWGTLSIILYHYTVHVGHMSHIPLRDVAVER